MSWNAGRVSEHDPGEDHTSGLFTRIVFRCRAMLCMFVARLSDVSVCFTPKTDCGFHQATRQVVARRLQPRRACAHRRPTPVTVDVGVRA
jgi:hypothetical protein